MRVAALSVRRNLDVGLVATRNQDVACLRVWLEDFEWLVVPKVMAAPLVLRSSPASN